MPNRFKNFVTYKINPKAKFIFRLKYGAKMACNFWNYFLDPKAMIVVHINTYTSRSNTVAMAWPPKKRKKALTGEVKFNTEYLRDYTLEETAAVIVHELGHTLGIGWDTWDKLFDRNNGEFYDETIDQLPELENMLVEIDGKEGDGTAFAHWDEEEFGREIMTGYSDDFEHVLPVTIKIMELLGHTVKRDILRKTKLFNLFNEIEIADMKFSAQQKREARKIAFVHQKRKRKGVESIRRA